MLSLNSNIHYWPRYQYIRQYLSKVVSKFGMFLDGITFFLVFQTHFLFSMFIHKITNRVHFNISYNYVIKTVAKVNACRPGSFSARSICEAWRVSTQYVAGSWQMGYPTTAIPGACAGGTLRLLFLADHVYWTFQASLLVVFFWACPLMRITFSKRRVSCVNLVFLCLLNCAVPFLWIS